MGGKASKEAPQAASSGLPADSSKEVTESGVVLAIDLQSKSKIHSVVLFLNTVLMHARSSLIVDKILQDFQSTVLKEEWENRQKYLLAKNSKRRQADFEFQEALKARMEAVRQQQTAVQSQLDEKAQALQARFTSVSIDLQDDVARFEKENLSIQPKV